MARLVLSFLDTFQVVLDRQPTTNFRSVNNQALLVYLALQPEKPFPREVLTALFWPDTPDKNARNNLRQSLFQLRKLLGDVTEPEYPYLLVTRQTVQFNPECDFSLDVHQFLQAIEENDLETAVSHYAGDLLPGFTCDSLEFEEWLRQERETLHVLALETMLEAARDCLRDGRYDKALVIARQQLGLEPWREQAHRQVMQAFALSGDRGNALAQYEACRKVLAEELGVEPAEETVKLYDDIKAGRYGALAATETVPPPIKTRHNLPADITPLIGREVERTRNSQLFIEENQRFVTIIGPGGMGKTRLSIAIGTAMLDHFESGVYFVDLAPLNDPEEIPQAIASVMNYQAPDNTHDLFPQLLATLSRQNLFFILDNFEHLLVGATLVTDILQACPDISVLVTSRQRLNLASESRFELGGLDIPNWLTPQDALDYTAVQLFVENGRRAVRDFTVTAENVGAVARICRLAQGMPLGLVLAASWLELLPPDEIAVEVERSLDFLAAELTDLPPRQRSMRAVFDYSWQMLTPNEQAVLAKLSVFRGGFTREAAEQVAGANLRVLLALMNKSLLQRQAGSSRYNMHELLRQFAAQKRRETDSIEKAALAHCHFFAGLMSRESLRQMYYLPVHVPRQYAADRENTRRAWDYALDRGLLHELSDLVRGIASYSLAQGIQPGSILKPAMRKLRSKGVEEMAPPMLHLRLIELGSLVGIADPERVRQELLEFVQLVEKNGELELLFWAYERLVFNDMFTRSHGPELLEWSGKIASIALQMEDAVLIRFTELHKLWVRTELGRQIDKEQLEELRPYVEVNYADTINYLILFFLLRGYSLAIDAYEQAIHYAKLQQNLAKQWQDVFAIGTSSGDLAKAYLKMGRQNEAGSVLIEAIDWHLAIGQMWQTLGVLWGTALDFPQLMGTDLAVQVFSMVYHHPEATSYYRWRIEEAATQFEVEMGTEAFAVAWEKGQELDFDAVDSLIRSALNSGETE